MTRGVVTGWDDRAGYGTITAETGESYFFHCTQLQDGSRTIDEGTTVTFDVVAGRLGRWEAENVVKDPSESGA